MVYTFSFSWIFFSPPTSWLVAFSFSNYSFVFTPNPIE
jgi:hypothetical protein